MATTVSGTFQRGQLARVVALFRKNDGSEALVDPAVVRVLIKDPAEVVVTSTYPVSIVQDAVGSYHMDIPLVLSGKWYVRWESDGVWKAADEIMFNVIGGAFEV